MDILRVKKDLADRAQKVAEHLLPNGVKEGPEWRAGSVDGEPGRSLGVHLRSEKAGVWTDFNTGEGGDLLDLWVKVKGITLAEALREAEDWLGISRPAAAFQPKKAYRRPPRPRCKAPAGAVWDYLVRERKIPVSVLESYKIGEDGDQIVFPFLLPNGDLALAKTRKAEAGAKPKPTAADCEPILFGWQVVSPNAREIIICEGEIDAMSWAAYGWPAVSVPFGGGGGAKQQWIENDFERMERFEKIYIATDMDKPGDDAAAEIAARLGRHRCYRVSMPEKDGNACLVAGVAKEAMDEAIHRAASLDPEGLRKPTDFLDEVVHLFWPREGSHVGYRTPYGDLGNKLLFRPAEMTLWSGASGAGKSQLLSDCAVDWVKQGSRICVSSLEMKSEMTLKRMCKQAGGIDQPTEKYIGATLRWLESGLLLYDFVGKAGVEGLIEIFSYARAKYGCDQFIVDSLMRLGIASDDYVGQEKGVFRLVDWTIASNVHLHLVAHSRKGGSQNGAPETEDVKGGMEIGANAFNVITLWRNKELEGDIDKMQPNEDGLYDAESLNLVRSPGVIANIAKQRNGDFEGKIGLWFDKSTYRYHSFREVSFPGGKEDFLSEEKPQPKFMPRDYTLSSGRRC